MVEKNQEFGSKTTSIQMSRDCSRKLHPFQLTNASCKVEFGHVKRVTVQPPQAPSLDGSAIAGWRWLVAEGVKATSGCSSFASFGPWGLSSASNSVMHAQRCRVYAHPIAHAHEVQTGKRLLKDCLSPMPYRWRRRGWEWEREGSDKPDSPATSVTLLFRDATIAG